MSFKSTSYQFKVVQVVAVRQFIVRRHFHICNVVVLVDFNDLIKSNHSFCDMELKLFCNHFLLRFKDLFSG